VLAATCASPPAERPRLRNRTKRSEIADLTFLNHHRQFRSQGRSQTEFGNERKRGNLSTASPAPTAEAVWAFAHKATGGLERMAGA